MINDPHLFASEALQQFTKPLLTVFDQLDQLVGFEQIQHELRANRPGARALSVNP